MDIKRIGSQPSGKGPAEYFTGAVRLDPLFQAPDPARVVGASVTFEPGARTAWHTHPLGQTLIVTAGCGWVQREGGPVEQIRAGDVVWFPPGEKHWHGATSTTGDDPHRHSGSAQRQDRRLDGEGQRRAIPGLIAKQRRPTQPAASRDFSRAPSRREKMWSKRLKIFSSCVTTMTAVRCSTATMRSRSMTVPARCELSAAVGSSARMMRGSLASARAIAMRLTA